MHEEFITYTIEDNCEKTGEQVREFTKLLQNGWNVIENFSYKNQYHFVLVKHIHEESISERKEAN